MTTSTAAHTSHRPAPTPTTMRKPSPTPLTSTAAKLGDCCSQEAQLTNPYGLQDSPTRYPLPTTQLTAVDLPVDDDQRHLNPSHVVVDPADDEVFSLYLSQWCDRNDEDFDYSSELDELAAACERMQRRPTATTMAAPITQPTATNPTQQSTSPPLQQCPCDDEDLFSSAIDDLVEACDRMQQRWPTVTTTLASPLHPNEPTLDQQTQSQPLPTLAYLAEFISDTEDRPGDCPPTPAIH